MFLSWYPFTFESINVFKRKVVKSENFQKIEGNLYFENDSIIEIEVYLKTFVHTTFDELNKLANEVNNSSANKLKGQKDNNINSTNFPLLIERMFSTDCNISSFNSINKSFTNKSYNNELRTFRISKYSTFNEILQKLNEFYGNKLKSRIWIYDNKQLFLPSTEVNKILNIFR